MENSDLEAVLNSNREQAQDAIDELLNAYAYGRQISEDIQEDRKEFGEMAAENYAYLPADEIDEYNFNMNKAEAFSKKADGIYHQLAELAEQIKEELRRDTGDVQVELIREFEKQSHRLAKAYDNESKYWEAAQNCHISILKMITNGLRSELDMLEQAVKD